MILAAIMLAQVPAPASGRPVPFGGVEVPNAIARVVGRYSTCLHDELVRRGAMPIIHPPTYRAAAEASIAACSAVRAAAVAEADTVLSLAPDYRDAERRRGAIQRAFDGSDFQRRNLLEIMDAVRRERETNAHN
jgi:hypothetical protein